MKLAYKNNWYSDEYYVGGKRIKTLEKVSVKGHEFKVKSREVTVEYSDYGHQYPATSVHYFIKEKLEKLGRYIEIDLNTLVLDIGVTPVEFTLEN